MIAGKRSGNGSLSSGLRVADAIGTFDLLEARDNPALSLEQQATSEPERPGNTGFDPYATRVFVKPKTRG